MCCGRVASAASVPVWRMETSPWDQGKGMRSGERRNEDVYACRRNTCVEEGERKLEKERERERERGGGGGGRERERKLEKEVGTWREKDIW